MATMICPRCPGAPLMSATVKGSSVLGCSSCGGVWLDHAASERVKNAMGSEELALATSAGGSARHQPETSPAIGCVFCSAPLTRSRVQGANVEVDFCAAHGTWFDRGELERVAQTFAAARAYGGRGGMGGVGVAAVGVAAVGVAAVGVGAAAIALQQPSAQAAIQQSVGGGAADAAIEIGATVVEGIVEAPEVVEGVFGILGAIFEGLGSLGS